MRLRPLRHPGRLADPVLPAGPAGYPPGVTRSLTRSGGKLYKIRLVLGRGVGAEAAPGGLPATGRRSARSRDRRRHPHRAVPNGGWITARSPTVAASAWPPSYSSAVTAIADLAPLWRRRGGDLTRIRKPWWCGARDRHGPLAQAHAVPRSERATRHPSVTEGRSRTWPAASSRGFRGSSPPRDREACARLAFLWWASPRPPARVIWTGGSRPPAPGRSRRDPRAADPPRTCRPLKAHGIAAGDVVGVNLFPSRTGGQGGGVRRGISRRGHARHPCAAAAKNFAGAVVWTRRLPVLLGQLDPREGWTRHRAYLPRSLPPNLALRGRHRGVLSRRSREGRGLAAARPTPLFSLRLNPRMRRSGPALRREPAPAAAFYRRTRVPLYSGRPRRKLQARAPSTTSLDLMRPGACHRGTRSRPRDRQSTRTREATRGGGLVEAYERAWEECDPLSAFGGIGP